MEKPGLAFYFWTGTLEHSIKRPVFGKPYFPFYQFLTVGQWVFQSGALLGRARRDKTRAMASLLSEPGMAEAFHPILLEASNRRLASYNKPLASFTDLFLVAELAKAGATYGNPFEMKKAAKQRVPIEFGTNLLAVWNVEGISFGIQHPDDVERMWRSEYEQYDPAEWQDARAHGLDIPEDFTPVTLEEREQQVLLITAHYAAEYVPEVLDELSLRSLVVS